MGIDYNAYIGPYIRLTKVVKQKKVDRCADHNFPDDAAYCPKCGTSKASRYTTQEVCEGAPDDWEYDYKKNGKSAEFHDYLMNTSVMCGPEVVVKGGRRTKTYLFLPNRYYKELKIPQINDAREENEVPFDDLDVKESIKKFKELFADEIAYMEQWFAPEIKFGYVAWCS